MIVIILYFPYLVYAQPKKEVRAVWFTTAWGLDWPKSLRGESKQKAAIIDAFNKLKAANFNTIYFQVRTRGDLMYPSALEPWAVSLSGQLGSDPGYNPLQFVIEEAQKRGMELHAWWVVYKIYGLDTPPETEPKHVLLTHPELCKSYGSEGYYMDPGYPETTRYLVKTAMEMIRNYYIDAIHFDYIRYPGHDFNDADSYSKYGGGMNKADWRRENINKFVAEIYDSVQAVKPWMKVGSAPIGIYVDIPLANGWSSYDELYQDSKGWVDKGIHDYLAPQTYWDLKGMPYYHTTAKWWAQNAGMQSSASRHVYLASAVYKMGSSDGNWSAQEVLAQIDTARYFGNNGQSFFRTDYFLKNIKNITELLLEKQYKYPANIPSMPWKDNIIPNSPANLTISTTDSLTYYFNWSEPELPGDGDTIKYYNLYADNKTPVDVSDIKNVIKFQILSGTTCKVTFDDIPDKNIFFAVTAYDYGNNESQPSNEVAIKVSDVTNIHEEPIADNYILEQNYPNPFNPSTVINYYLAEAGNVKLAVYDVLGRETAVLVNEFKEKGNHQIDFTTARNNLNLSSGIYFYTISVNDFIKTKKMTVIK